MLPTLLMFVAAICLSVIAGYYSVVGMTSIFSGALIPIILMSGTLETSKVIVASWLYNNWNKTHFALKAYLTAAVVVLMLITSMGIFGFLSKAHLEQAAAGAEQQAQIQRITQQIDQQNAIVAQARQKLANLGSDSSAGDAAVNARLAEANKIIEQANQRVQPQIDEQQRIIDQERAAVELRAKGIQSQVDDVDKQVATLDSIVKTLVDKGSTNQAQRRQQQQQSDRDRLARQKSALIKQMDTLRNTSTQAADTAKAEIAKIRAKVDTDVKQARDTINSMSAQLGQNVDTAKVQEDADRQNARIKDAGDKLEQLTTDKFKMESENRKLEVEVGPIKYIAQMIYGDNADNNLMEHAVRWVIMTLIFVFDPMAVLMLIAANQGMREWSESKRRATEAVANAVVETEQPVVQHIVEQHIAKVTVTNIDDPSDQTSLDLMLSALSHSIVDVDELPDPIPFVLPAPAPAVDISSMVQEKMLELVNGLQIQDDTPAETVFNAEVNEPEVEPVVTVEEDGLQIGRVIDTADLIDKLQRSHAARLKKFSS